MRSTQWRRRWTCSAIQAALSRVHPSPDMPGSDDDSLWYRNPARGRGRADTWGNTSGRVAFTVRARRCWSFEAGHALCLEHGGQH